MGEIAQEQLESWNQVKNALTMFWNWKFNEAEEIFATKKDTSALYSFFYSEVEWARALISEDSKQAESAFKRISQAHKLAKKSKEIKYPNPQHSGLEQSTVLLHKLLLGQTALYDSALKFKLQQNIKGVYNFRKSWKYFEAAVAYRDRLDKSVPFYEDINSFAQLGLGFFLFIISVVPREWLWLVEGIGFTGDRARGLQELQASAATKSFLSAQAMFHMLWIKGLFLEEIPESIEWMKRGLEMYPTGAHIYYMGGYTYRKDGKLDDAENCFKAAHEHGAQSPQFQWYCEYDLGYNYYLKLDWRNTAHHMERFLENCAVPSFRTAAACMLAVAYEMMFFQDKAAATFKKLLPWVRKNYDYDEYAERKVKKYFNKKGFSMFDRKFLIAMIHFEACRWEDTSDTLDTLNSLIEGTEDQACFMWLRAASAQKLGKRDDAIKFYQDVLAVEKQVKAETFVFPNTYVGLGEIAMADKRYDEAEKFFKKAKGYSNYDFSQLLQWKVIKLSDDCYRLKNEAART